MLLFIGTPEIIIIILFIIIFFGSKKIPELARELAEQSEKLKMRQMKLKEIRKIRSMTRLIQILNDNYNFYFFVRFCDVILWRRTSC